MTLQKGYIVNKYQLDYIKSKIIKIEIESENAIWFYGENATNMKRVDNKKIIRQVTDIYRKIRLDNKETILDSQIELINLLKEYFDNSMPELTSETKILYEEVTDQYNNKYGKELLTGIIVPIGEKREIFAINKHTDITSAGSITRLEATRKIEEYHDNVKELYYGIEKNGIATEYDVEEYKEKFNGLFGNHRLNKWKQELKDYIKINTYISEIEVKENQPEKEKTLLEQDTLIEHMEIIEYFLLKLKNRNIKLYNEYKKEYQSLLENADNQLSTNPLNIQSLAQLEAKIEFNLHFETIESEKLLSNLTQIKEEYLKKILEEKNNINELTLKDLDKISELFLIISKNYSPVERREIIKKISFLYLLEIYLQKDKITEEELKKSYFKNNLKTIMICIESLKEVGLVNENIYIDLETEPTIENILYIIKKMEITPQKSEPKKLIKEQKY